MSEEKGGGRKEYICIKLGGKRRKKVGTCLKSYSGVHTHTEMVQIPMHACHGQVEHTGTSQQCEEKVRKIGDSAKNSWNSVKLFHTYSAYWALNSALCGLGSGNLARFVRSLPCQLLDLFLL